MNGCGYETTSRTYLAGFNCSDSATKGESTMKRSQSMFRTLALVGFTLILTPIANAQASRTWVSGVGDDVNPCSRTAPCKTFAGAISKTARDGEIDALDPAGFGAVTITKSITIDGSPTGVAGLLRSEEHTSELQSLAYL